MPVCDDWKKEKEAANQTIKSYLSSNKNGCSVSQEKIPKNGSDVDGTKVGSHLESPNDIKGFPQFPSGTTSLLHKCLTPQIWGQLESKKDEFGFDFRSVIFSGCKWTSSGVGVYAGSHDSYKVFAPFFDKIIAEYHGHKPSDKHISNMDYKQLNCPQFSADENKMIISTRIRIARNLSAFPLGTAVNSKQRKEIEKIVVSALNDFDGDLKGKYFSLETMTEAEREQLVADHFLFKGGDKYMQAAGMERDWPEARGIYHNDNKTFLVWVNEEDHLRIISMQKGADIGAIFQRLADAANKIEAKAQFAKDEHLGYISTCPTNLGTGVRASVLVKLPKLGQNKALHQSIADEHHVQVRGLHGEHSDTSDGIFDISNKRRLGQSEVQLVQDMYDGVKAMIKAEQAL